MGQRGQELVQSWLWRNGEQTARLTLTFTHAPVWRLTNDHGSGLWPRAYFIYFFVSLCWDCAAIMSKRGRISAWQRQAVDSGVYVGSTEVSFCRGVCSPCCRSSYTRVSNGKLCLHWWRLPFLFFWKGPIRRQRFRADLSIVILIGESQGYTASAAELRQSEPPVWMCYFCFCVKTLIKYKYTADCTVYCKCQDIFQVCHTCCVHKNCTKLKAMWIKSVPQAGHSGGTWDLIWWDWF